MKTEPKIGDKVKILSCPKTTTGGYAKQQVSERIGTTGIIDNINSYGVEDYCVDFGDDHWYFNREDFEILNTRKEETIEPTTIEHIKEKYSQYTTDAERSEFIRKEETK